MHDKIDYSCSETVNGSCSLTTNNKTTLKGNKMKHGAGVT